MLVLVMGVYYVLLLNNREIITVDFRDSLIQGCFQAHSKKVNTVGNTVDCSL